MTAAGAARVIVRSLGRVDYAPTFDAMRAFTGQRGRETVDELWLLEHPPVYTLGLKANAKQLAAPAGIAVLATDRGGDVTYHGPGQPVVYVLMDLQRRAWGIRRLVTAIEQAVIDLLAEHEIIGERRPGAPGIYVGGRKIAALGLRVRRGATYHGLALNVDMDLAPFALIDPCGYPGLEVTQLGDLVPGIGAPQTGARLIRHLCRTLEYTGAIEHGGDNAAQLHSQQLR